MPRQTKKYVSARQQVLQLGDGKKTNALAKLVEHDDLYAELEKRGYYWDAGSDEWRKGDENARAQGKFSGSIFEDFGGVASGVFRLRIMCHPDDLKTVFNQVVEPLQVVEVSEKIYDNRRGPGVRVYVTCKTK